MTENDKEQKQGITYVSIPGEVAFNKKLNKTDTFVFWMIKTLDSTKKHCWASNDYIAKRLNISKQTVSNAISKLKKQEYITQIDFDGRKRTLKINNKYHEKYRYLIEEYNSNKKTLKESFKTGYNDPYKQPIRKVITDNNNNNNTDKILPKGNIRISSEIQEGIFDINSKDIPFEKNSIIGNLLKEWNGFGLTEHKFKKTKTLQNIKNCITQLVNGTFYKNNFISTGFLKKNDIPQSWKTKKWKIEQIHEGIKRFKLLNTGGYWPPNKSKLPDNFLSYFYNDNQKTSWFLMVMKKRPWLIKRPINEPKQVRIIKNLFKENNIINSETNQFKLNDGLQSIVDYHDRMQFPKESIRQKIGTPAKLCQHFIWWLEAQHWITNLHVDLKSDGKIFQKFISSLIDEFYGYDIRPREKKVV